MTHYTANPITQKAFKQLLQSVQEVYSWESMMYHFRTHNGENTFSSQGFYDEMLNAGTLGIPQSLLVLSQHLKTA